MSKRSQQNARASSAAKRVRENALRTGTQVPAGHDLARSYERAWRRGLVSSQDIPPGILARILGR